MPSSSAQALALSAPDHHRQQHCGMLLERIAPLRFAAASPAPAADRRLTRLLVNVTVDRSLWPLHVVVGADATVADLVRAAVEAYVREGRRPPLPHDGADDAAFDLHLSKYSLESLRPDEKVMDLGSRNFFLCPRRSSTACFV